MNKDKFKYVLRSKMTLEDLEPGMIICCRNNETFMLYGLNDEIIFVNRDGCGNIKNEFDEKLFGINGSDMDIIEVKLPRRDVHFQDKNWINAPTIWVRFCEG